MDGLTSNGKSVLDYSGTVSKERADEIAEELNKHQGLPDNIDLVGVDQRVNSVSGERETFVAIIDYSGLEGEQRVTVLTKIRTAKAPRFSHGDEAVRYLENKL